MRSKGNWGQWSVLNIGRGEEEQHESIRDIESAGRRNLWDGGAGPSQGHRRECGYKAYETEVLFMGRGDEFT